MILVKIFVFFACIVFGTWLFVGALGLIWFFFFTDDEDYHP